MRRIGIVGGHREGKTTTLLRISEALKERGVRVGGFVQTRRMIAEKTQAYDLLDLSSMKAAPFAKYQPDPSPGQLSFRFVDGAWERASSLLFQACKTCDLIVVDELGRLEADKGTGHMEALSALDNGGHAKALLLGLRRDRLERLLDRLGGVDEWHSLPLEREQECTLVSTTLAYLKGAWVGDDHG